MPPRASWKGFLNLSLVSVPVKAYTSSNSGGQVRLNQLHAKCNSRIKQKTICPTCAEEVPRDEIVKGYEYAKDQYVVIDLDELEKLRSEDDGKAIRIDRFVEQDQVDPIYFSDTTYYLVPDGAAGQKSYGLLHTAMSQAGLNCLANVVLHNKEQLVLVRPMDNLLCMTILKYASQVKSPSSFDDELIEAEISDDELVLAKTLIEQKTAEQLDIDEFKDQYTDRLTQLIESKVKGEEIVAAPATDVPQVLNLMEALKASVTASRGTGARSAAPLKSGRARKPSRPAKKAATKGTSKSSKALANELAKPKKKQARRKKTG